MTLRKAIATLHALDVKLRPRQGGYEVWYRGRRQWALTLDEAFNVGVDMATHDLV